VPVQGAEGSPRRGWQALIRSFSSNCPAAQCVRTKEHVECRVGTWTAVPSHPSHPARCLRRAGYASQPSSGSIWRRGSGTASSAPPGPHSSSLSYSLGWLCTEAAGIIWKGRVGSLPAVATHPSLRNVLILLAVYCVIILRIDQQDTLRGVLGCMYSSDNAEGDESQLQGLPLYWL